MSAVEGPTARVNRDAYLAKVAGFIQYLAQVISGSAPIHPTARLKSGNRLLKTQCLADAFEQYTWNREDYAANRSCLDEISSSFSKAFDQPGSARRQALIQAIEKCMKWGLGGRAVEQNVRWACDREHCIDDLLRGAVREIAAEEPDFRLFADKYRMNSGYTKVYSLICADAVIYDGRVGAAMGLLVRHYCARLQANEVPPELRFPWGVARGGLNRDPSRDCLSFPRLRNDGAFHAEWNVKANWALAEAVRKSAATWCSGNDGLRRVEAALFMLGYQV